MQSCDLFFTVWKNGVLKKVTCDFEISISGKGYYSRCGVQVAHRRACMVWGVVRGESRVVSLYTPPMDRTGYETRRGWQKLGEQSRQYETGVRVVGNGASDFISVGEWDKDGITIKEYDKKSDTLVKSEFYREIGELLQTLNTVLRRRGC